MMTDKKKIQKYWDVIPKKQIVPLGEVKGFFLLKCSRPSVEICREASSKDVVSKTSLSVGLVSGNQNSDFLSILNLSLSFPWPSHLYNKRNDCILT